jgi:maleate cis-trans isomerase
MDGARRNPFRGGKRVGLIIPSVNATIEPELAWLALPGLSFHGARVMLRETTPEGVRAMNAELGDAARLIASVAPDVVAFACTSGSFLDGPGALADQLALIGSIVGCPVVATSAAMIAALRHLGIRRIALATPYLDSINEAERRFFEANHIAVAAVRGLGLSGGAIREVPPEAVVALARSADAPDAEALFISCTDLRALETVAALEAALGKPVLTSNQVTLWGVLRALGRPTTVPGCGRLLA